MLNPLFNYYFSMGALYYHRNKNYQKALDCYIKANSYNKNNAKCIFKIGMCYFKMQDWHNAKTYIQNAIALNPNQKHWKKQLDQSQNHIESGGISRGKLWWKEVEDLKDEIATKGGNFARYKNLAIALEMMLRFKEAAQAYSQALKLLKDLSSIDAEYYYKMGYCYEKGMENQSDLDLAKELYKKAISIDEKLESNLYGIGVFHQNKGLWIDANKAYLEYYNDNISTNHDDNMLYKIGMSFDRLYDWENAAIYYEKALEINYHRPYTHYRLGFVYERQKEYEKAAYYYQEAVARNNEHKPYWHYRLGYCLNKLGKFEEANKAFIDMEILHRQPKYTNNLSKNHAFVQKMTYVEFSKNESIKDNIILYQSHTAKYMSCNPYAIFSYLLQNNDFKHFTHIWAIQDLNDIPSRFKKIKNIIFVKTGSVLYLKYLASAKYLINSGNFFRFFTRREGQKYLNTWHGTPWKHLGKDIKTGFMPFEVTQKDFLQSTHIISPNRHTSDVLLKKYDIENIYTGICYESGYPRIDLTLKLNSNRAEEIKDILKIKNNQKVVLYAPTYRNNFESGNINFKKLISDIKIFQTCGYKVLFRGHYVLENKLLEQGIDFVPRNIDTNELLNIVDVLIGDYSSISFDYMVLDRPIIYYVYDYNEYEKDHGLYFDIRMISSIFCKTAQEVLNILKDDNKLEKCKPNKEIKNMFIANEDGQATQRVVDMFFLNKIDKEKVYKVQDQNKINMLIYPGSLDVNGITSSFINFINYIDTDRYDISIAVDVWLLRNDQNKLNNINKIKDKVHILGNPNILSMDYEEEYILTHPVFKIRRYNDKQEQIMQSIFERDFRCLYGDSKFDVLINFDGYGELWISRFAYSKSPAKKLIYFHSDMQAEFLLRFPYLEKCFNLCRYFDKILSVSNLLNEINSSFLHKKYGIASDKFSFINNIIDYQNIIFKKNWSLKNKDEKIIFDSGYRIFITIGRLSKEKNHIALIESFKEIHKKHKDIRLVIIGDGPLKGQIDKIIKKLNMSNVVFLLGRKENPYSYLNKANYFILPSLHEGQPIVILEALVLQKPIIASDIAGCRDVLNNRGGVLVKTSKEGFMHGIQCALDNKIPIKQFNYIEYNDKILSEFDKLLEARTIKDYKPKKIYDSPCIIMAKPDGFGMRIFSLIAGLVLSKKTELPFYFKWEPVEDVIGNKYEMFNAKHNLSFSIGDEKLIFDNEFLDKHLIFDKQIRNNHGFMIHNTKRTFEDIKNGPYENPWGWYAPSIGGGIISNWIENYSQEECYADFAKAYKEITFSEEFALIQKNASNIAKELGHFVAIHIRGADIIFSSTYKKASLYGFVGDKYFPYEIALELIQEKIDKQTKILIFTQDIKASKILIDSVGRCNIYLADEFAKLYSDLTQRAFFEMNLMSYADIIYTPGISLQKSAFSQVPSCIAGIKKDISFHDVYTLNEQYEILKKNILKLNIDSLYHSMAYFRLYQLSLKINGYNSKTLEYLLQAKKQDNDNIAWDLNMLDFYLHNNNLKAVESWLKENLQEKYQDIFDTLFMHSGLVYKYHISQYLKLNLSKQYPYIVYLIMKLAEYRKDGNKYKQALEILEKYNKDIINDLGV